MTGLPNRNNLHNYLDDLVDKAVSPWCISSVLTIFRM